MGMSCALHCKYLPSLFFLPYFFLPSVSTTKRTRRSIHREFFVLTNLIINRIPVSGVATPEQDGVTTMTSQGLRKDSKVAEQIPEKGPGNGCGLLEDWKNSLKMAKGEEETIKGEDDGKKTPVGAGELGEIYDSGSDDSLGDGSEDDANDEFDDAARPGQSATQYGCL